MNNTINLAVLGLGTVGTGVLNLIKDNVNELARRSGHQLVITHAGTPVIAMILTQVSIKLPI